MNDRSMIETVRGFNRIVTQRVGALQNSYLARDRSLAESRVLWEIGERDCEVRTLRSRLDLDSGYLSRLLRSLEASGLVTVGASQRDKRIRRAQLTEAGRRERALLDARSDELARSMLTALSADQRDRLVSGMARSRSC
jgi:DNA-binding MarR family transcriptional regulator